uniref:Uncharacterized protein n=1 Tax=Romanomermis culicivorax TaxID=13658 RepID=A0A915HL94_ROMCU
MSKKIKLNKNMPPEIDSIQGQLAPNAGNVLPHRDVLETHDTMPRKNPLRELRFDGPQLYFPATAEMPDKHLLFDTKDNLIKKRIGYDVLNHLNNVKPETSIVEADLNDISARNGQSVSKILEWNIVNLASTMNDDILNVAKEISPGWKC